MKIIKSLSMSLALIFFLLTFFSCNPTPDKGEQNNTNNGSSGTSHYYGVKTLYSYEDVMDALAIVRQKRTVKPTYTVKDMGENYTIFYQFRQPHYNRPYPIDYEDFFTNHSSGAFYTYIFLEDRTCFCETHPETYHASDLHAYMEDEDYEKLIQYVKNEACIKISTMNLYNNDYFAEIGLTQNLSYYSSSKVDQFEYFVCLRGIEIMQLNSCVELDDTFFELLFENIVTTSVKE